MTEALVEQKAKLRRQAYDARNAQENKDEVSRVIVERFVALPEYAAAHTAMWYLDVRSEVRTRHQLGDALNERQTHRRARTARWTSRARTSSGCGISPAWTSWSSASGRSWSRPASDGASRARKWIRATWIW